WRRTSSGRVWLVCRKGHEGVEPIVAAGDAPRVLLVEDDPVLLTILSRYLGQRGCCVLRAASAAEGLEIFAHTPIDVTVSDVRMPGMSGHELLQEVRRRDAEADLILIT